MYYMYAIYVILRSMYYPGTLLQTTHVYNYVNTILSSSYFSFLFVPVLYVHVLVQMVLDLIHHHLPHPKLPPPPLSMDTMSFVKRATS